MTQDQKADRSLYFMRRWRDSAYLFVVEALGATPSDQQKKVLLSVKPGAHISIRSGHGVGKTALLAWLVLWFMCTRPDARIPCTAGSKSQLRDVLWPEIAKWMDKLPADLAACLDWMTERIVWIDRPQTWFAVARTARKESPEALQGFHEKNLMFLIDEAPGVPDEIFEVSEGAMTEELVISVMTGNPTRLSGQFYRSHHKDRHLYQTFHFSSKDSVLVGDDFAERIASKYGKDSDVFRVRVDGDFPLAESDTFIPLHLIEEARLTPPSAVGDMIWGLDPARFGDDESALVKRRGKNVPYVDGVRKFDNMHVSGWVAKQYNETPLDDLPKRINIDTIGLGGGVFDRLNELGLPVVSVNVQEAAKNSAVDSKTKSGTVLYGKVRDELWGLVRDDLHAGLNVGPDEELSGQLCSPKYKIDSAGRIVIESNDDMKKRGIDSPDRACALGNTYYVPPLLFPGLREAVA